MNCILKAEFFYTRGWCILLDLDAKKRDIVICRNIKTRPSEKSLKMLESYFNASFPALKYEIYCQRVYNSLPDPEIPSDTHLGWKAWIWNSRDKMLYSPFQWTPWPTSAFQAHTWSNLNAIEGECGIHALHLPNDWRKALWIYNFIDFSDYYIFRLNLVTGIVERYGKAVVGPYGWRAEHVVIRGLVTYKPEVEVQLRERYPNIEVVYRPLPDELIEVYNVKW